MRITLDIDNKRLEEVLKLTGEKRKSAAIKKALLEYVRHKKIEELRALAGKIELVGDWIDHRYTESR